MYYFVSWFWIFSIGFFKIQYKGKIGKFQPSFRAIYSIFFSLKIFMGYYLESGATKSVPVFTIWASAAIFPVAFKTWYGFFAVRVQDKIFMNHRFSLSKIEKYIQCIFNHNWWYNLSFIESFFKSDFVFVFLFSFSIFSGLSAVMIRQIWLPTPPPFS